MRISTEVYVLARQIGVPDSESISDKMNLKSAIHHIGRYLVDNPMRGSHFEFKVSTDRDKIAARTGKDATFDSIIGDFDFGEGAN